MKHTFITFILLSLCIFTYAQKKIAREYIEWSDIWIPGANKTNLHTYCLSEIPSHADITEK